MKSTFRILLYLIVAFTITTTIANASIYDFESTNLPTLFSVYNNGYTGTIGTTTSRFHDGSRSLEISSPSAAPGAGMGVRIPISGNDGHISWWYYDAYGSSSPIYMWALLHTTGTGFHMGLMDSGWGGLKSSSIVYQKSGVEKYGPLRVKNVWTKIELYIANNLVDFYVNGSKVDTIPISGNLVDMTFGISGYSLGGYWIDTLTIDNFGEMGSFNYSSINSFPVTTLGTTNKATSTFTNIDATHHPLNQATITGTNAADFTIANDSCSNQTIKAGDACTLDIVFSPTAVGNRAATLNIASGSDSAAIPLTGTGVTDIRGTVTDLSTGLPLSGVTATLSGGTTTTTATLR